MPEEFVPALGQKIHNFRYLVLVQQIEGILQRVDLSVVAKISKPSIARCPLGHAGSPQLQALGNHALAVAVDGRWGIFPKAPGCSAANFITSTFLFICSSSFGSTLLFCLIEPSCRETDAASAAFRIAAAVAGAAVAFLLSSSSSPSSSYSWHYASPCCLSLHVLTHF